MIPDIIPELEELIRNVSNRAVYGGAKISPSIMRQFEIESTDKSQGILVPYWLSVTERGRGIRRSNKDHGLVKIIYKWMERKNMFRSVTAKGKYNEARYVTWYINKYGNKQFQNKVFVDVYTTERKKTIDKITAKYGKAIATVTMDII